MNHAQRRKMKGAAAPTAALMAARCFDFHAGGNLVRITAPAAVAALTHAFTLLLRFSGKPVAMPIAEAEARGQRLPPVAR